MWTTTTDKNKTKIMSQKACILTFTEARSRLTKADVAVEVVVVVTVQVVAPIGMSAYLDPVKGTRHNY